jgi:polygalacturonase
MRDTKNPILMDSDYEHGGKDGNLLPQFTDLTLRNVHIFGGGKVTLDGYDSTHKLRMTLDDVTFADLDKIKVTSEYADLVLSNGSTDFHPTGQDVHVVTKSGKGAPNSCQEKFVPYPGTISVKE